MYAVTSVPLERRTRATFRKAELGFLGVMVLTCKHTPRFCGQPCMAGCLGLRYCWRRGFRTSWLIVGIYVPLLADKSDDLKDIRVWSPSAQVKRQSTNTSATNLSLVHKLPFWEPIPEPP